MGAPKLLNIVELGGYPDFRDLYQAAGFEVLSAASMRKALGLVRSQRPAVVVAEFNFQSDFRDRTSSLESLLATVQGMQAPCRVVVFYEREYETQFDRVRARFPIHGALRFPIEVADLQNVLHDAFKEISH